MRSLALILLLSALPAAAATTDAEKAEAAERMAAGAQKALDAVLGPGRSQVRVEVQGDRSEVNSETEILTPIDKSSNAGKAATRLLDLPGYAKDRVPDAGKDKEKEPAGQTFFQREREQSRHDAGFQIRSVQATVILDASLDDAVVREVSQLLPQLLKIDTTRGDALSILRAPMRPAWKTAFSTPGDWRSASYALGGAVAILLAASIGGFGLVRAGRALGRELASRPLAPAAAAPLPVASGELLPELAPGAGGFLDGPAGASGPAGSAPLLGRRFDFLVGRDTELVVRALSYEKPEDLSLFFGHLAESIPDLASRLFALLPPDRQAAASTELLKLSLADPERLGAIEERLRQAIENGVLGPQSLGRLLSRVSGDARADMLGRIAARDESAAREVSRHVFGFEDLTRLPPAALRRLLTAVPFETWGAALRGAPKELVEAVLAELPTAPRGSVRDAVGTAQPREKVDAARSRVLDAVAALEAKGELAGGRAEAGGGLV
jgi:hypothetical protein